MYILQIRDHTKQINAYLWTTYLQDVSTYQTLEWFFQIQAFLKFKSLFDMEGRACYSAEYKDSQ